MPDSASFPADIRPSAFAAFRSRDFRLLQVATFASIIGMQMQSVAVGWQLYEITGKPLDLGYLGAALFLPALIFSPLTGHSADRFDRRRLLALCHSVLGLASLMLYALVQRSAPSLAQLYTVIVVIGTARAFLSPAAQAIMPGLVPTEVLPNAVAWSSTTWHVAVVTGPALGGVLYAQAGASGVYLAGAALELWTILTLLRLRSHVTPAAHSGGFRRQFAAGLAFVWRRPIILGAISLDLFAVLFGGAVALLPVYARDILETGPRGLGLLRSAPALGALAVALLLAYKPVVRRAGIVMLGCVALFGLGTILFGVSRHFALSLLALAVTGAADMVSVFIRHNLVQLRTPDDMRGRVAAVNMIFIGASNELGEFESGVLAQWLGAVPAVVLGGVGTCLVVLLWAWWFPSLRRIDRLDA